MFVRTKRAPTRKNPDRQAVQLVASHRIDGKVRQKIIDHIGYGVTDKDIARLRRMGEHRRIQLLVADAESVFSDKERERQADELRMRLLKGELGSDGKSGRGESADVLEMDRGRDYITGIHDVYGEMYRELGLDRLLPAERYPASSKALRHIVMARLAEPRSKLGSVDRLETEMGVRQSLSQVYRMMDHVDDSVIERLNRLAVEQARAVLPEPPQLWLFDCTTLYFESFVGDELKQPGYSKDAKFKESQVLLALIATREGLPLRYQTLPGATFEGKSLAPMIDAMRREHELDDVICVADRGLMSEHNVRHLERAGVHYVIGARLRSLNAELKRSVLDPEAYSSRSEDGLATATFAIGDDHPQRRLVVGHSLARAARDRHNRLESVNKLLAKLRRGATAKSMIGNRGHARFLRESGDSRLELDPSKLTEAERWDGLAGVLTDLPANDVGQALGFYRDLWRIEETFRVTKHDLRARPIFHWTPRRIKAHLAIAFMSLLCVRHLQYRVNVRHPGSPLSPAIMRDALTGVRQGVFEHRPSGRRYAMPYSVNEVAAKLYRCLNLKPVTLAHLLD